MASEGSRRARRMERHHNKNKGSGLNLVSLMDIFTILVFFLLVNSTSTQQLPSNKDLKLPNSIAKKAPEETLVIAITDTNIIVQGRAVASVSDASEQEADVIDGLKTELEFLGGPVDFNAPGKKITVMADQDVPYGLMKKILATCQQVNYTNVAFVATQVAKK